MPFFSSLAFGGSKQVFFGAFKQKFNLRAEYGYTGSTQTFNVPSKSKFIRVRMWGGGGSYGPYGDTGTGRAGGAAAVDAYIPTNKTGTCTVYVARRGGPTQGGYGYGKGGGSTDGNIYYMSHGRRYPGYAGGGGGGSSAVVANSTGVTVIAGGGGGAGGWGYPGDSTNANAGVSPGPGAKGSPNPAQDGSNGGGGGGGYGSDNWSQGNYGPGSGGQGGPSSIPGPYTGYPPNQGYSSSGGTGALPGDPDKGSYGNYQQDGRVIIYYD